VKRPGVRGLTTGAGVQKGGSQWPRIPAQLHATSTVYATDKAAKDAGVSRRTIYRNAEIYETFFEENDAKTILRAENSLPSVGLHTTAGAFHVKRRQIVGAFQCEGAEGT